MPSQTNGVPAVDGNSISNTTPAHPAFDSIPDVIEAFGTSSNTTFMKY